MKNILKSVLTANILVILIFGASFFGLIKYNEERLAIIEGSVNKRLDESTKNFLSLEKKYKNDLENIQTQLLGATDSLEDVLLQEQTKNETLKADFNEISAKLNNLAKLSATDKELLKKYSKVYFLNEHYVPISLASIDPKYLNSTSTNSQIHSNVLPFLEAMLVTASADGMSLKVQSAYRSFPTQATLKSNYTVTYGAGTANRFSADQGYSEHQLGTTVDFTTQKLGGTLVGFDKTPEYEWLQKNAYRFGFILSYPPGNVYYKFEPWHWRYVGIMLATRLHTENIYFYDLDQRIIDSYLGFIFE